MGAAGRAQALTTTARMDIMPQQDTGLLTALLLSLSGFTVAGLLWWASGRLAIALTRAWRRLAERRAAGPSSASAERMLSEQFGAILTTVLGALRAGFGLLLIVYSTGYALSLFPRTQEAAAVLDTETRAAVNGALERSLAFLPDLLVIIVLVALCRLLVRFARIFFTGIGSGRLRFEGFHADWAAPTFQIVRVLLIAFTVALIYPYLPASDSRAFQGVTVLLGVLVSFGSASAIANLIGGLVLTYMRALAVGDRVRIGEVEGDVVGRDAFVVRLRTVKNVEVTVPNATVLTGPVLNYSVGAREGGLALHTRVTIGYDVPWRDVHALLIAAGEATMHVEPQPRPFVLQTALDDCYVEYELNVHTRRAQDMPQILSDLRAHIQDRFAAAGIEILSPIYEAHRSGERRTVPPAASSARGVPGAVRYDRTTVDRPPHRGDRGHGDHR